MENEVVRVFGNNDLGANTLLILGNGFDLDLGLNTRYSDFANSEFWPFKHRLLGLGGYLNRHRSSDKWFDLELSMANYCEKMRYIKLLGRLYERRCNKDERDDKKLIKGLQEYLIEEFNRINSQKLFKKDSVAARILRAVCTSLVPGTIYTFNYTNLKTIAKALSPDVEVGCSPNYIHGELSGDSIILGFNERRPRIPEFYVRFCKNRRAHYSSTHLFSSIVEYDNIVFHGLSFGEIDNVYFANFFKKLAAGHLNGKYIRIITKDNNSRQSIFKNVQMMSGTTLNLYKVADFKILTTDGTMDKDIDALIKRLLY